MTVFQLIELLKTYPGDIAVVTRGQEYGADAVESVELVHLGEDGNMFNDPWHGRYSVSTTPRENYPLTALHIGQIAEPDA